MADNVLIDNGALTDYDVATDKVTYSGDADRDLQLTKPVHVAGAEGAKTVEAVTQTVASAAPAAAVVVGGTDGTNVRHLKTDTSGELQVDVLTLPALVAGTANIGDVDVLTVPAPLSTTGGGTEATALRVTIANDSTGVVSVDDNGGALTVDGTVTANLAAGTNNIGDVDVLSVPAPLNVVGTGTEAAALRVTIATDSTGVVSVDDNGGSLTVDGTVAVSSLPALVAGSANIGDVDVLTVPAPLSTTGGGTEATALRVTIANDSTGVVSIDDNGGIITVDGTVTLGAGTANVGDVDVLTIAAGDNNIGNVDIVTMPNVTLAATTNTIEVVGDVAHDTAASGNPVQVAGTHETIADSAPTNRLATVTDGDVTRLSATDGALYVIPSGPQQWKARLTGLISADTTVKAAPGAGLSLYIQTVVFSIGAATASSILLEESTTTAVFGPHYLEAISGRGMAINFNPPIKIAANTLLSATGTGSTTATLDVYGFTAPG